MAEAAKAPRRIAIHAWVVLREAVLGFVRNDDLRQASSLAFYTSLALIPALLLLTYVLSLGIGSSQKAMQRTAELVTEVIPRFGEVILQEVGTVARHKRTAGLLNLAVLMWSLTPLVAALRSVLNGIFKVQPSRPFWVTKALDLAAAAVFVLGASALASAGLVLKFLKSLSLDIAPPAWLRVVVPFALTVLLLAGIFWAFTPRMRHRHLFAGAFTTALLWFLLRPAFALFLTHNPGYGLAFGSFKSLFIVFIWIYYSMAVLLIGAEVMAAFHRKETLLLRRAMEGKGGHSVLDHRRFVVQVPAGHVFFREGEAGSEMYHVLKGSAAILKGQLELAVIGPGKFFGEMTFLLGLQRSATAVAKEPMECIVIHEENVDALMREFPGTVREMLTEMASRLRETSRITGMMPIIKAPEPRER